MIKHKHKDWQTNLSVCPDCGRKQRYDKKKQWERTRVAKCENPDCETEVVMCRCGQLIWWNDNWV